MQNLGYLPLRTCHSTLISSGTAAITLTSFSTVAMEELWVTLALVSASTPALMRLAKRFTTSGVTLGTTQASSKSGSRTKEFTHKLASFNNKNKVTTTTSKTAPGDMVLRPD